MFRRLAVSVTLSLLSALAIAQDDVSASLLAVNVAGKFGYVDSNGNMAVPPTFDEAEPFSEGLAAVRIGDKWGFVDASGRMVIDAKFDDTVRSGFLGTTHTGPGPFSEGLAAARVGDAWGYVDRTGELVIAARFSEAGPFRDGVALVRVPPENDVSEQGLYALRFIDHDGRIAFFRPLLLAEDFSEGLAHVVARPNVIEAIRQRAESDSDDESADPLDGLFAGFIDVSGRTAFEFAGEAGSFSEGLVTMKIGDKWGYADPNGELVIPATFDFAGPFADGRALVTSTEPDGTRMQGFIDRTGRMIVQINPEAGLWSFSDERALVRLNGFYGYLDTSGNAAIPLRYTYAQDFENGLAIVQDKTEYFETFTGVIDTSGRLVWQSYSGSPLGPCTRSIDGTFDFTWGSEPAIYRASLRLNGCSGTMEVAYPVADGLRTVTEAMQVHRNARGVIAVGSEPREAGSGTPAANYASDNVLFAEDADGELWPVELCDASRNCFAVTVANGPR